MNAALNIEGYTLRGVSVFLDGKKKSVRKTWVDYLERTNGVKLKSKKTKSLISKKKIPYWKAKEIQLTNVGERYGDLITVFQIEDGRVKMSVIFKLGYNTAINQENFPEEFSKFQRYVEYFAQVNFREYYDEHIKELKKSIKVVDKEIRKESSNLRKLNRKAQRYCKKNKDFDPYLKLEIEVQNKLLNTLKFEKNNYGFMIMKYKNRNSEIRSSLITQ
ncbi:MAG: hypothetical protein KKH44_09070 [Bacteroidetes bacterium]|nr:hypothetical protein [Bacteroidota bacterium]